MVMLWIQLMMMMENEYWSSVEVEKREGRVRKVGKNIMRKENDAGES